MSDKEKAKKYEEIVTAWKREDYRVIDFMRKCKEIIDGVEIPVRKSRK
ncbi:hypothetical protein [Geomicrobium sp. JCM 19037]|nr:hypothetical protein [Geomicrobium sp. JCM 19037]